MHCKNVSKTTNLITLLISTYQTLISVALAHISPSGGMYGAMKRNLNSTSITEISDVNNALN